MPNPDILNIPVKTSLKLVTAIGFDGVDTEIVFIDNILYELDHTVLVMFWNNLERSNARCIINGCVLEALHCFPRTVFKPQ